MKKFLVVLVFVFFVVILLSVGGCFDFDVLSSKPSIFMTDVYAKVDETGVAAKTITKPLLSVVNWFSNLRSGDLVDDAVVAYVSSLGYDYVDPSDYRPMLGVFDSSAREKNEEIEAYYNHLVEITAETPENNGNSPGYEDMLAFMQQYYLTMQNAENRAFND